ncbi:hypothetical protein E4U21_002505 [Claviceps maximensis]|nr:hypothetical protein E4U21_002505 [Claviceps maximensis]
MPLNGDIEPSSIYISLNGRVDGETFHWGVLLTDPEKKAIMNHATNSEGGWKYEARPINPLLSMSLIALIFLGKTENQSSVLDVMKKVPADGKPSCRTRAAFNSGTWVTDVVQLLHEEGVLKLPVDIASLEAQALRFGRKYARRAEQGGGATVVTEGFSSF